MASNLQIGLPDPGTALIRELIHLHDFAIIIGVLVTSFVGYGLTVVTVSKNTARTADENHLLEILWTIIPAIILFILALPSIRLLYAIDEIVNPSTTVKAIGHQWYWSYEYGDFDNFRFDSYIVNTDQLLEGQLRLLEVDRRIVLPTEAQIRLIITGADVIHAWAVPSLGVKIDAVPGRLNQVGILIQQPGIYRGMCSELCGSLHAFMPIVIEAIPKGDYTAWAEKQKQLAKEE